VADGVDSLRDELQERVGQSLGGSGVALAPDPVNLPMIRHWVDALEDRNPIYLDEQAARASRFGGLVAPPAMLQVWTFPRPIIEGIAARGGSPTEMDPDSPLVRLDQAGYTGTLATNSELQFDRYLRPGERLSSTNVFDSLSELKGTALGAGYFVTWVNTYLDEQGRDVGRQIFRVFKFAFGAPGPEKAAGGERAKKPEPEAPTGPKLPDFDLDVTATRVVAGAIASRDFMPVHHDRDYAQSQGAPDIFMNILTTNGYVARYLTDWAGPQAELKKIDVKLGAPAVPGKTLRFRGQVIRETRVADERVVEVAVSAANDLGPHATGRAELTLPA